MVIEYDILSISEINSFISRHTGEDHLLHIRNILVSGGIILSSRDKKVFLLVETSGRYIGKGHIYTSPEVRGKKVVTFIRETQEWGRDHTDLKYIFNYTHDMKVQMLMQYIGAKRIGEYKGHVVFRQEIN